MRPAAALALLLLAACASGHGVVTGTPRKPVPVDSVQVYAAAPPQFEIVGKVTASSPAGRLHLGSRDRLIQELRKQAARLGANGLLLGDVPTVAPSSSYGMGMYAPPAPPTSPPPEPESKDLEELSGTAIFVTTQ